VTVVIVRMVHVAIMVAVLRIVVMIVGVVVHPVHPLHFTRPGRAAHPFELSGKFDTSPARIH
jgi:hypothetical protein